MTEQQQQCLRDLRDQGYLIVVWTPDELAHVPEHLIAKVEDSIVEYGNETIACAE